MYHVAIDAATVAALWLSEAEGAFEWTKRKESCVLLALPLRSFRSPTTTKKSVLVVVAGIEPATGGLLDHRSAD